MITDKNNKEFEFGDFFTYLRNNNPVLAKVVKIIIGKSSRIVCDTVFITEYETNTYYNINRVTIKNFQNTKIISKLDAFELFPVEYEKLTPKRGQ